MCLLYLENQIVSDSEIPLFEISESSSHRYVSKGGICECNMYNSIAQVPVISIMLCVGIKGPASDTHCGIIMVSTLLQKPNIN